MPQTSKKVRVLLQLEPRIAKLLDEKCGGPRNFRSPGPKGSGRAGWIISLLSRELGVREDHDELGILDRIRLEVLEDVERLVVELYREGRSTPEVLRFLYEHEVPPKRGKRWYPHQVENLINVAAAKSYKWILDEIEEGTEKTSQNS